MKPINSYYSVQSDTTVTKSDLCAVFKHNFEDLDQNMYHLWQRLYLKWCIPVLLNVYVCGHVFLHLHVQPLYMKTTTFCSLQCILAVKCVLEAGFREQVRIGSVHFESVTVIYNAQRFSAPCAGLLSLLAALSPEPAVLTGEMDVSLWCRLNKSPSSLSIFISCSVWTFTSLETNPL